MGRTRHRVPSGFTLVELLVACALGLGVGAVALSLFARQVRAQREQLVEARLQQDIGAAAELIVRSLRRAGHRGLTQAPDPNPYRAIEVAPASIGFSHSRDPIEDNRLDARERTGFRLDDGVLQAQVGGRWQALTDPAVVIVDHFDVALAEQRVTSGCASVVARGLHVALIARPAGAQEPARRVAAFVGLRNDDVEDGACAPPG